MQGACGCVWLLLPLQQLLTSTASGAELLLLPQLTLLLSCKVPAADPTALLLSICCLCSA
jgi:hypothetical protein